MVKNYYDYILVLIPLTMITIPVFLITIGMNITTAIPIGATICLALIGHAMFINDPVSLSMRKHSIEDENITDNGQSEQISTSHGEVFNE